jgi:hypothetical protein
MTKVTRLSLILVALIQVSVGIILVSKGKADVAGPERAARPVSTPQPSFRFVAVDSSNFDPSGLQEQLQPVRDKLEELEKKLGTSNRDYFDKTRITELREILRDANQAKLTLIAIDSNLSQLREAEIREAGVARQTLSSISPWYGIGPNTPTERLQSILHADLNEYDSSSNEIAQERKLLRGLGGRRGDRLEMIDDQSPNIPNIDAKIDAARSLVRSILGVEDTVDVQTTPAPPTPPASPDSPAPSNPPAQPSIPLPPQTTHNPQEAGQKDNTADETVEKAVDAALRLFASEAKINYLDPKIQFEQTLIDGQKRLSDYHQVDVKVSSIRDQIALMQTKVASLQEAVNQGIDASVNQIGGHEWFTWVATCIFGAAVIIVIGSFFTLAFRDKANRLLVDPDVGLQFVTLFSIIIAIILFGILNILGSKELSALLGGISGYILGRGTLGSRMSNRQHQCPQNQRHQIDPPPSPPAPPDPAPAGFR